MTYPVTILTLFPEAFPGLLGASVMGRALAEKAWNIKVLNIRDFALDKHRKVDDAPFGGGAGMVMKPDVVAAALRAAKAAQPGAHTIYLSPSGTTFIQPIARRFADHRNGLIILCGHYEGVDQRVLDTEVDEIISLGNYVLSGGEPAAVCLVDAVVRLLPGVLGAEASLHEESFDIIDENGEALVEYPHYTRPAEWEGQTVPQVLTNGNHSEIKKWRMAEARKRTRALKP
ncbi:MAG TPA: tRNA (guanosine(37)-N1)-methyltransferase TrmD [Alphaproteobacteria bacterium]|nr:tRNA (guanosine(37)-N1)-methyltransferase TrmD [Alphaproteobacteria bacterium]